MKMADSGVGVETTAGVPLDYWGDFVFFLQFFAVIFVVDTLFVRVFKWFPEKASATRYFSLHVLVNAFVVVVYFDDVIGTYKMLQDAFLAPTDTSGAVAIFALHVYHIVFFQPLDVVDWVHHFVMIIVMLPLAYTLAPGHMLGHGCFYASGLPGGIDYLLLVLIKCKVITKMQEKKWNVWIQNWIRAPGCLIQAWLTYNGYCVGISRMADPNIPDRLPDSTIPLFVPALEGISIGFVGVVVVILSFYWNGQYFLERVIRSHERNVVLDETLEVLGVSMEEYKKLKKQASAKKAN
eukprot:m.129705 g.129705  ORF g.129705 m.129705 type:complete len:294 (-) comp9463_c0_seq1:6264-7145(-)